ncbi:MAG: hypothetical protein IPM26_04870 [Saprospiraceae bacterium]|nr:hypothetical protein [Saprospiraceae bacterium]
MKYSGIKFLTLTLLVILSGLLSCSKDDHDHNADPGKVILEFEHVFGPAGLPFSLNKEFTHPRLQENMTFSTFRYYISNIRLRDLSGNWWSQPESYYIVDAKSVNDAKIKMNEVPAGTYDAIEILFGVDSLRNVSGAQSGALSPSEGMFWSWNTGYIMLKAEGTSPASADGTFAFHLGGFSGPNAVPYKRIFTFNGESFEISKSKSAQIHFKANTARLWHSSDGLAVRSKQHMPGPVAATMSKDFYDGVVFDHIHK